MKNAAVLLLLGSQRHYLWELFPTKVQADVWNICGAIAVIGLIMLIDWGKDSVTFLIVTWFLTEETLTAGCSSLYLVSPWPILPGEEQCSYLFGGVKLGVFTLFIVAGLAWKLNIRLLSNDGLPGGK